MLDYDIVNLWCERQWRKFRYLCVKEMLNQWREEAEKRTPEEIERDERLFDELMREING